jgi:hypothetical protein
LFASEALKALDSYDMRNRMISAQPSLSSTLSTTTTSSSSSSSSSSPVSSKGKKAATISVLKLTEEKQEHRTETLQSWEDVAHKVVKALSELLK